MSITKNIWMPGVHSNSNTKNSDHIALNQSNEKKQDDLTK